MSFGLNEVAAAVTFLSAPIALPRSTLDTLAVAAAIGAGAGSVGAGAGVSAAGGGVTASSFFLQPASASEATRAAATA